MERGIEQPCALEIRTSQVLTLNNRGDRVWRMARVCSAPFFTTVQADVVTDWNVAFEKTLVAPGKQPAWEVQLTASSLPSGDGSSQ